MTPSLAHQERSTGVPRLHPAQACPRAESIVLHRLRTPEQIGTVLHLRGEIDLSVHAAAGQEFVRLEKKETRSGSSSGSSTRAS